MADMASNRHDRLVGDLRLGQLCDDVVPEIVKPQTGERTLDLLNVGPQPLSMHVFPGLCNLLQHWIALVKLRKPS
jgi:hypothetical protein